MVQVESGGGGQPPGGGGMRPPQGGGMPPGGYGPPGGFGKGKGSEPRAKPPKYIVLPPVTGSGELVDRKHRLILTNVHVVGFHADAEELRIYFPVYDAK